MRRDALSNQPTEELAGAIGRISSQMVRFKSQSFLGSRDHCLRRRDFVIGAGGSSLHIDDHGVLNVDQIIEPITELHTRLLAFAVQAEHGSTGEITFGSLRSAFPSSSSSAVRNSTRRGSDALAVTSRSHPEPYR